MVRGGWCGSFDPKAGIFYDNHSLKIQRKKPVFPLVQLNKFDRKNNKRYAFRADVEFDDATLHYISRDTDTSRQLNEYFLNCIHSNQFNQYIGFHCIKNLHDLLQLIGKFKKAHKTDFGKISSLAKFKALWNGHPLSNRHPFIRMLMYLCVFHCI